jgi:hypothetical protein
VAARDQARPTSGVETNPAALDATQTEAGPTDEFERQLAATKEALDAADILASMQMEDVLFDGPPAPSDGQPPANFPNANEQFNTLPPPGFNENSPRFNVGSNEALTTGFLPDETIARELERLRARASELETLLARADGVCTPDSERSTADDDDGGRVADDHSAEPSGIPDLSNALLLHGQPHTARDMRSWSPRAREIFEDWVYEERIVMKKKVMIEQLTQARLELFFQTFYHPSPEVERQRPEERPRRSSEPAGEFPPANLEALAEFYKMHERWKQFVQEASPYVKNTQCLPSEVDAMQGRLQRLAQLENQTGHIRAGRYAQWEEAMAQMEDPEWEAFETDPARIQRCRLLEAQNRPLRRAFEEGRQQEAQNEAYRQAYAQGRPLGAQHDDARRALAQGGLSFYREKQQPADTDSPRSPPQEHDDDSNESSEVKSQGKKKRPKRSKGRVALKTKKELAEIVQRRMAAQSQSEQQSIEPASSAPAADQPSASLEAPVASPEQLPTAANEPQARTSSIPQAAEPETSQHHATAADAKSEDAKANQQGAEPEASRENAIAAEEQSAEAKAKAEKKEKAKAKKKAYRENKQAKKKLEAEDKKMAEALAREEAAKLERFNVRLAKAHRENELEREAKEREAREREAEEREAREREVREREAREREVKEREAEEQEFKEREAKAREASLREVKELEAREQGAREREPKEQEAREQEIKERETKEREAREKEASEREAKIKDQETKEREASERETKEREAKKREIQEREAREREAEDRRVAKALEQEEADRLELENWKAKARIEKQKAMDREAEDRRHAIALAKKEAEKLASDNAEAEARRKLEQAAREREAQDGIVATVLARQESKRTESNNAKIKAQRESQLAAKQKQQEARDDKMRVLAQREVKRLELEKAKAKAQREAARQEAEDKRTAAALAQEKTERLRQKHAVAKARREEREARVQEARKREAEDRRLATALAQQDADRLELELEVRGKQKLHSQKLLALLTANERPDPQTSHSVGSPQRDAELSQGEQTVGPESRPPVAAEQTGQTPDETAVTSRPSSDRASPRVEHHATFLITRNEHPRLPSPRSDSSGPDESSFANFAEARRDQKAGIQQITALRQQRIEFAADGSSSATTPPTRRIFSAVEREESSGVTHPEPLQPDVQREPVEPSEVISPEPHQPDVQRNPPLAEAAPNQHSSNVQQDDVVSPRGIPRVVLPPRERPRVVFILGSETSEADTDTTAEEQLALNERVALSESAHPDVQQQDHVNTAPPHDLRRVVFQLASETSEADTDTTAERQLERNAEADRREAARRISLNLGEIDVPTDSLGDSSATSDAMTSDAPPSPVRQAPNTQTTLVRAVTSMVRYGPTSQPLSNGLVSNTVPYGSRRGPRPGNVLPNPHGHPPTPNDYSTQRGPQDYQESPVRQAPDRTAARRRPHGHLPNLNGYPAQNDPRGYQQSNWSFDPTAGHLFPDPNGFYYIPDVAPPPFIPSPDMTPSGYDGRTTRQRRVEPVPVPSPGLGAPFFNPFDYATPRTHMQPLMPMQPPMLMHPPDDLPRVVYGETSRQRGRSPTRRIPAPMQPQDDLPCIVDGRTPEQRRRSPLLDIRAPPPPRRQAQDLDRTQQSILSPQSNGTYRPPHMPIVLRQHRGHEIPAQAVTMPTSMTSTIAPPRTSERDSRPTEHRLSLDPNMNVSGGDECGIASSTCSERGADINDANDDCAIASSSGSDRKGDVNDADDESSGKDP